MFGFLSNIFQSNSIRHRSQVQNDEKDRSTPSNAYAPKYDKIQRQSKDKFNSSRAETEFIMESRMANKFQASSNKKDPLDIESEDDKNNQNDSIQVSKFKVREYSALDNKSFNVIQDIRNDAKNQSRRIVKAFKDVK